MNKNMRTIFWCIMYFLVVLIGVSFAAVEGWQFDSEASATLVEGDECNLASGKGVCTIIEKCTSYAAGLRQKSIKYESLIRCSFSGLSEVICCPKSDDGRDWVVDIPSSTSTAIPITSTTTIKNTTATTTTTISTPSAPSTPSMNSLIMGSKDFIDLSKLLNRLSTTTLRTPRRNRLQPLQNPTEDISAFDEVGNTIEKPVDRVNGIKFPEPTVNRQPPGGSFISEVEWIKPGNNEVKPTSSKWIWLSPKPSPVMATTENPRPLAQFTDPFDPYKFRPSVDSPLAVVVQQNEIVNNQVDSQWEWTSNKAEGTTVASTSTTETSKKTLKPEQVLDDWMLAVLYNETTLPENTDTLTSTSTSTVVSESITVNTSSDSFRGGGERPSLKACNTYKGLSKAGLTFHIIDGLPVEPGEYPHMGGLIYSTSSAGVIDVRCGSSLISKRYLLTAAHCVNDPLALPTHVRLGVVELNSTDDTKVDIEIENITLHDNYRSQLRYHDIALIKLKEDVQFTPFVKPACLYQSIADVSPSILLSVTGWGVTNIQTRSRSEILLMTNVTTVPLSECNATHISYGVSRSYRDGLNEGHYCAFDPELKKDACQSDSGGPLQIVENRLSTIVGIVSFGLSCGSAIPSVYTRVGYYLDWIESIVWPS